MAPEILQAPLMLEYPFTRSTGPAIGAFLTGLRDGVICGIRRAVGHAYGGGAHRFAMRVVGSESP